MANFVLVPGAWHGGWCYSRVAARLLERSHNVFTPTLSGLDEIASNEGKPIDLATHVSDVVDLIVSHELHDVVLAGHSYAGMVVTGVAGQVGERIKSLFYIDACVPDDGQCALDMVSPERARRTLEIAEAERGWVPPPSAHQFNGNPADFDWIDKQCTPHPIGSLTEALHFTGQEALVPHRTYVLAARYISDINHPAYAKLYGQPEWKAVSLDCGHEIMLDEPDALTKLLLDELDR